MRIIKSPLRAGFFIALAIEYRWREQKNFRQTNAGRTAL